MGVVAGIAVVEVARGGKEWGELAAEVVKEQIAGAERTEDEWRGEGT